MQAMIPAVHPVLLAGKNRSGKTPSAKSRAGPKPYALQNLLTLLAGPVGELRMRSSEQAVALGLLLLAYTFGSPA
jgi:hypothetical protein